MPVLDHFRAPLKGRRSWESFHTSWPVYLANALNELLPEGYLTEIQTQHGAAVEIDVAGLEEGGDDAGGNGEAGGSAVATSPRTVWTPPQPPQTLPAVFPRTFEVRVINTNLGGPVVRGAIELVSPRNKDRPESRRAFAIQCAGYLAEGIGLIVVDIVTGRSANLHNLTMRLLKAKKTYPMEKDGLYAVAYRPLRRGDKEEIDLWKSSFQVGGVLPKLPLSLAADFCLPVDLEAAYLEACRRERIPIRQQA